jgi:hypothetical protein
MVGQIKTSPHRAADPLAYADGDYLEAGRHYVLKVETGPTHPQLWAGLALTLRRLHLPYDISSLLERGEVVALLYSSLRSAGADCDPVEPVLWLSKRRTL